MVAQDRHDVFGVPVVVLPVYRRARGITAPLHHEKPPAIRERALPAPGRLPADHGSVDEQDRLAGAYLVHGHPGGHALSHSSCPHGDDHGAGQPLHEAAFLARLLGRTRSSMNLEVTSRIAAPSQRRASTTLALSSRTGTPMRSSSSRVKAEAVD
jgi:hypothetical protein